jgi:Fe-S cluster assembly ATP-binding protein
MTPLLEIKNLHASIEDREILKGIDLTVNAGEVHAIMGPNGSGKSTLASVLAGKEDYTVTEGTVLLEGKDLLEQSPEDRSREGLFLAFQYPVEIPGVSTANFLKSAVNEHRKYRGEDPLDPGAFLALMREKMKLVEMDPSFLQRSLNEGFSGGEKKRNEIFQMAMLEPKVAVRTPTNATIVITHYQRLLDYIIPDVVHVLWNGKIVRSGDKSLALELEKRGYDWIKNESSVEA